MEKDGGEVPEPETISSISSSFSTIFSSFSTCASALFLLVLLPSAIPLEGPLLAAAAALLNHISLLSFCLSFIVFISYSLDLFIYTYLLIIYVNFYFSFRLVRIKIE
jgi:hypothetical protein